MSSKKKIPKFRSEKEEREFWRTEDSTCYVDWSAASRRILPRLRPTLRSISIRLPDGFVSRLKVLANKRDVPYQSLMKMYLAEKLEEEERKVRQPA